MLLKLLAQREWFSGRTLASQARNEGSIPFSRSIPFNESLWVSVGAIH
jgi:hypothetical protein